MGSEPERLYILLVVSAVAITGFLILLKDFLGLGRRHDFAVEYFDKLDDYIDKRGEDAETYAWLIKRSNRMQNQLSSETHTAVRRKSAGPSQYREAPVIMNLLPEIRSTLHEGTLARGGIAVRYGSSLLQELLRHIGAVEDARKEQLVCLRNPFVWLREGVRFIVELPVYFLSWLGIMSEEKVRKLVRGAVVRAFAAFVTAVGLIGAIAVVSLGWPHLRGLFQEFIKWVHHLGLTRHY